MGIQTNENVACATTCNKQICTNTNYKNNNDCLTCNDNCFKKKRTTTRQQFTNTNDNIYKINTNDSIYKIN
jgi:hypothetical protein